MTVSEPIDVLARKIDELTERVKEQDKSIAVILKRLKDIKGNRGIPNAATRKAIDELEQGKGRRFSGIAELMDDLNADD